jgi:ATPase family associated with various cellular activities (AAA)
LIENISIREYLNENSRLRDLLKEVGPWVQEKLGIPHTEAALVYGMHETPVMLTQAVLAKLSNRLPNEDDESYNGGMTRDTAELIDDLSLLPGSMYALHVEHTSMAVASNWIASFSIIGKPMVMLSCDRLTGNYTSAEYNRCYVLMAKDDVAPVREELYRVYGKRQRPSTCTTFEGDGDSSTIDIAGDFGWDNLILDDKIVNLLKNDFESFFKRKQWFADNKLPYKRGYLLHGSPGNGKTSILRAMMNSMHMNAYTLRWFAPKITDKDLDEMFTTAAKSTKPTMILLEDIDRAFPKTNRTCNISLQQLLNSLDGVGNSKNGLIVVATANEPTILDPAILKRPGRFDRSILFPDPSEDLRARYFFSKQPDIPNAEAVADSSGFSFAQLQEAYIIAGQTAYESGREINSEDLVVGVGQLRDSNASTSQKKKTGLGF